jgi:hypothetical protein
MVVLVLCLIILATTALLLYVGLVIETNVRESAANRSGSQVARANQIVGSSARLEIADAISSNPKCVVRLVIDRAEASPADLVRATETIPRSLDAKVIGVSHKVIQIGVYDECTRELVNLQIADYRAVNPGRVFSNLSEGDSFPHNMWFDVTNPREKGTEFEFSPKQLGVFLIYTEWTLRDGSETLSSNPVLLVVKVPMHMGKPAVVKPEWLPGG